MTVHFQNPELWPGSDPLAGASRLAASGVRPPSSSMIEATARDRPATGDRELRLDLFRGLALCLIFIDHLSPDRLSWITIPSYGFSGDLHFHISFSLVK